MESSQALDPLRSLRVACKLLRRTPLTVLVGGLLIGMLGGSCADGPVLLWLLQAPAQVLRESWGGIPVELLLVPFGLCTWAALFALRSWLEVGFARALALGLRAGEDDVARVFTGRDRLVAMLLARVLSGLVIGASILPFAVAIAAVSVFRGPEGLSPALALGFLAFSLAWFAFALYVGLGLVLVDPIVALEGLSPTASIARSWKLARGQRLRLCWFVQLQTLLDLAGLCCCLVGQFLTTPLVEAMRFEVYLALTRGGEYPQWWIGSGRFPFDEHKPEDHSSPTIPPQAPPPHG
jgi:hypothetical protein